MLGKLRINKKDKFLKKQLFNDQASFYFLFSLFLSIISSPDIIYYFINQRYGEGFFAWLLCTAIFYCPLIIFRNYVKIYAIILLPLILFSLVDVFSVVLYNVPINYDIFLLALNTNYHESAELLSGYLIYFLLSLVIYGVGCYFIIKYIPRNISLKSSITVSAIALLFIMLLPFIKREKGDYIGVIKANIVNIYPGSFYYASEIMYRQIKLIDQHDSLVNNFRFGAKQKATVKAKQIYVMMIGESSRYDHWEINHYYRQTSPNLQKLKGVISFDDMITGGYITEFSVPMLISRATATDYNRHYREKSIVSAFKEAGFKTYWISNQVDFGDILMHSKEADESFLLSSDYKATKGVHSDMELVAVLGNILKKDEEKVFVVIHTLGSHYDYDARYPANFNVFQPSSRGQFINPTDLSKKDNIINSYDNSILYTDAVIDSAIKLIQYKNPCAWVSYTSDHGENLFDDDRRLSQHGYSVPSQYVAHIPWFIWTSPSYDQHFPNKVIELRLHKSLQLGSENVFYTLTDLGNLTFPGQNFLESVASKYFKPEPQLILGGNSHVFNFKELH